MSGFVNNWQLVINRIEHRTSYIQPPTLAYQNLKVIAITA